MLSKNLTFGENMLPSHSTSLIEYMRPTVERDKLLGLPIYTRLTWKAVVTDPLYHIDISLADRTFNLCIAQFYLRCDPSPCSNSIVHTGT